MMKKGLLAVSLSALILGGCNLVEEANNALTYASDMTDFIGEAQQFAADVPTLLEQASSNPEIVADVQSRLTAMQEEIDQVQSLQAPGVAEDIHNQVVEYSTTLEGAIQDASAKIENGVLDPAALLENTELQQTIQQIVELRTSIEQLGQ